MKLTTTDKILLGAAAAALLLLGWSSGKDKIKQVGLAIKHSCQQQLANPQDRMELLGKISELEMMLEGKIKTEKTPEQIRTELEELKKQL